MSSHFKTICQKCEVVIAQCRCFGPKTINYELCDKCEKKELENWLKTPTNEPRP